MTYEKLRRFDAGFGGRIPLLEEVLDEFGKKCFLNIELKEAGLSAGVKKLVLNRGLRESVIISAFDADDNEKDASSFWAELKGFLPEIPVALLVQKTKVNRLGEEYFVNFAKDFGAMAIHPEDRAVTPTLVALAHKEGIRVHVWTVNKPKEIAKFKRMKVDGIISDFPKRLK